MTRTSACTAVAAVIASAVAAQQTHADIIMGNLDAPSGGSTIFGGSSITDYKAYGFTMGDDAYFLDDVVLNMVFDPGANPVISIWAGETAPEMQLAVLDNPPNLEGKGDYVFSPSSQFTLEANHSYWVHVQSDPLDGPDFLWLANDPPAEPTGIAESLGYIYNDAPSTFTNRLQINGTLVPAPGALALLGMGFAAAGRRRRS